MTDPGPPERPAWAERFRRLTLGDLLTLVAFVAVAVMAVRVPVDTDMYWHLRTGQYIVETRSVPTTDPFSWTAAGSPWVNVHWLSQLILYGSYAAGGWPLVALATAAAALGALVLVWRQLEGPLVLRAGILVLTAATAGAVWTARSQMATFLLTAIVSNVLSRLAWGGTLRWWILPVVFLLWVNLHGGYVAGFLLIGGFLVGETIDRLGARHTGRSPGERERAPVGTGGIRRLGLATVVSVPALLLNPHGLRALALPLETVTNPSLQAFVHEWASPDFHEWFLQPMLWMLLLTLVAVGRSGRRLAATDAITVTGFAYLAFLAQRNVGLFALVSAPVLARHASTWWDTTRLRGRPLSDGLPALNWAVAALVVSLAILRISATLSPANQTAAEQSAAPVKAVDWIDANQPAGPMFNSYNWGGYLLWRLWPDYPTYVDGRTDIYSPALIEEYQRVALAREPETILDHRGIALLLIESGGVLDATLGLDAARSDSRWRAEYRDDQAVVWIRR